MKGVETWVFGLYTAWFLAGAWLAVMGAVWRRSRLFIIAAVIATEGAWFLAVMVATAAREGLR
jgi:hypothetical protein